ncbi:N-acetylglucosamine-6-phosphate deacetylase [soil metagenome]
MNRTAYINGLLVRADRIEPGVLITTGDRITSIGDAPLPGDTIVDLRGRYLTPGFVEIHVHGGGGADFMDLSTEAFRTVCRTHAKHGTTSLTPTSTVADTADYATFLQLCRDFREKDTGGARVIGAHHYGPYFYPPARGCHPKLDYLTPSVKDADVFAGFGPGFPCSVTIAPELPHAQEMTRACVEKGIIVNLGHSHGTFEQVEAAMGWGATHVDHLFCAMSDRARLRIAQPFPMRGGLLEATLSFQQLTTEVIADGHHLADSLLRTAYLVKGPDRLALVTDSMRAVDCPDGEYWFGPKDRGELIRRRGNVGVTLDGTGLASGVLGLDDCVRVMANATKAPLYEVIRMATLTPARIIGLQNDIGSLQVGKRADLLVMSPELQVEDVVIGGKSMQLATTGHH